MSEQHDNFIYNWVTILSDSMRFFLAATRFYQSRLEEEIKRIVSDDLFSELFSRSEIESLDISKEANRFREIGKRLQAKIEESPDAWSYDLTLRHKEVRVLKALSLFYLAHLQSRRDRLARDGSFSTVALQALDSRISRFEELLSSGVFGEASPWPLLIEPPSAIAESDDQLQKAKQTHTVRSSVRVLSKVDILDPQLRERCLDLLEAFDAADKAHRFDTVITEATRVLEDRVRRLAGADSSVDGVKLMTYAFGSQTPRLVISQDPSEQEAAHLMFRGVFGYIRNPFHHRLIGNVATERVIQILGMIDYLLMLAQSAYQTSKRDA